MGTGNDPLLRSQVEEVGSRSAILRLEGEIDLSNSDTIVEHFRAATGRGISQVIIDATGVTFVDSSGLSAFVEGKRLVELNGSRVIIVPSAPVRRLLEITSLDGPFEAHVDSLEEGLAMLEADGI